jgi:peroxiredoxin Q/BCP
MRLNSALLLTLPLPLSLAAQQPAQTVEQSPVPVVGAAAPDFAIRGATRYGLVREPVKLSDFKGQTVVLAFFVRARTRG